jgi:MFS family permease
VNREPAAAPSPRGRYDAPAVAASAVAFSFALGVATVAFPLIALQSGYSGTQVGVLTACSAITQMTTRTTLAKVMRHVSDRSLVTLAACLVALSTGVLTLSTALVPFVLAQLLQGAARACFWTGSQTHVVRGSGSSVSALAMVNFVSSFGLLAGPVVAGVLLEQGATLTLLVASGAAVAAVPVTLLLDKLPPFSLQVDRPPGRFWRRPGVDAGCWAGVSAGAWRGLVSSYVPVALQQAGQSSSTIGALVSAANAASVVGAGVVGRVTREGAWKAFAAGTLATGLGTAAVAAVAGSVPLAAVALALSGLGAGALQTIGPAVATEAVHPEERGEAIAVTGTFRAGALFAAPLGVAALILSVPLTAAMTLAGALIALPVVAVRRRPSTLHPAVVPVDERQ